MSLADKLERLARIVPGVAGYQDRERSRATDKAVRVKLGAELDAIKRDLERDTRALAEAKDFALLPALDRLGGKLDKLRNTVEYAARGYRPVFDTWKLSQERLERLYTFDLGLFEEIGALRGGAAKIHDARGDRALLTKAIDEMDQALDRLETTFSRRQNFLIEG